MPFALVIIGLVMIVTGAKDTHEAFGKQLVSDFTGPGNFTFWIASLGGIGALGYFPALRDFSRAFMALILIGMVLANRGFFNQFSAAMQAGPTAPAKGDSATTAPATGMESLSQGDAIGGTADVISGAKDLFETGLLGQGHKQAASGDARQNFSWIVNTFGRFFMPGGSTVPTSTPMF